MVGRFVQSFLLTLVAAHSSVARADSPCVRIVSLAPSVTEVIYELGLGTSVVGVTRFCRYPEATRDVQKVGGFYDANLEEVARLKPTHVFVLKESGALVEPLQRLGITATELDHANLAGIRESIRTVGQVCQVSVRAEERLSAIAAREREICERCRCTEESSGKRTMVVVGRTREGSQDSGVYLSGRDGFYSELLLLIGASNVHSQGTVAVPGLSQEGIMALAPDTIIEIVNVDDRFDRSRSMEFWSRFQSVPAVRNKKVFLVDDDFASIPGPRYISVAQKLSELLCVPQP
jgi:iron complex transport system substrate-binding protein